MRIGIYRACGIGDAVQLTPLLQQVRADFPAAEVVLFVSDNVASLFDGASFVDRCVSVPGSILARKSSRLGNLPLFATIRRHGKWDIFLCLEPRWRAAAGVKLVSARKTAGFVTAGWKPLRLFTHPMEVESTAKFTQRHQSIYYLQLWEGVSGCPDSGFGYNMRHLLEHEIHLPELPKEFVCLAPGSGNIHSSMATKRWPAAHWLELAELLNRAGLGVVWLGSASDASEMSPAQGDVNLMGRIDLKEAAHVLSRSKAVVGNDSGMFHLALGLGVKAVGLYGPTNVAHVGSFRTSDASVLQTKLPCVPCHMSICMADIPELTGTERPYCMHQLRPEAVMPELIQLLEPSCASRVQAPS